MTERMPSYPDFSQPDAAVPGEGDFRGKTNDYPDLPNLKWLTCIELLDSNASQAPALPEEIKTQGPPLDNEPLETTHPSL